MDNLAEFSKLFKMFRQSVILIWIYSEDIQSDLIQVSQCLGIPGNRGGVVEKDWVWRKC